MKESFSAILFEIFKAELQRLKPPYRRRAFVVAKATTHKALSSQHLDINVKSAGGTPAVQKQRHGAEWLTPGPEENLHNYGQLNASHKTVGAKFSGKRAGMKSA
jgi:hypothetical protein